MFPALGRQQLPASFSCSSETNEPANSTPSTGMTKPEGDLGQSNHFLLHAGIGRAWGGEPGGGPTEGPRHSSRTHGGTSQRSSNTLQGTIFSSQLKHRLQSPGLAICPSLRHVNLHQSLCQTCLQIWGLENMSLST